MVLFLKVILKKMHAQPVGGLICQLLKDNVNVTVLKHVHTAYLKSTLPPTDNLILLNAQMVQVIFELLITL